MEADAASCSVSSMHCGKISSKVRVNMIEEQAFAKHGSADFCRYGRGYGFFAIVLFLSRELRLAAACVAVSATVLCR